MNLVEAQTLFTERDLAGNTQLAEPPDKGEPGAWAVLMTTAAHLSGRLADCKTNDDLDRAVGVYLQKRMAGEISDADNEQALAIVWEKLWGWHQRRMMMRTHCGAN